MYDAVFPVLCDCPLQNSEGQQCYDFENELVRRGLQKEDKTVSEE